jgi:hypothetical protein
VAIASAFWSHRRFIAERLEQNPHLTLHGLKAELASQGITVSHAFKTSRRSACADGPDAVVLT